jgi:pantoate--beta-alanine ligase
MSSRNVYLSAEQRAESTVLYRSLQLAEGLIAKGGRDCPAILSEMQNLFKLHPSASVEYISIADSVTLEELHTLTPGSPALVSMAVRIGGVRLIDNVVVQVPLSS